MTNLIQSAKGYISRGISVIPTNSNKRSIFPWKEFQGRLMNDAEIKAQFSDPKCEGIAVICGKVSQSLECVDVDLKNDITGMLLHDFMLALSEAGLLDKLLICKTKNDGRHLLYWCSEIAGNAKLASRPATEEELKKSPNARVVVLIETRGEAGYIIAPPTQGYEVLEGTLQEITPQERETLWNICRSFNEVIEAPERPKTETVDQKEYGLSPFEDFNMRGDAEAVLVKHGWTYQYERGGRRFYRRPGKNEGISADFLPDKKWFKVFTTSSQFVEGRAYNPAGVFALLECNNDFSQAAKKLLDMGYGEKRVKLGKMEGDILKKKRDGVDREQIKGHLNKNYSVPQEETEIILSKIERQQGENIATFWDVHFDKEGLVEKVTINRFKMQRFLRNDGGFCLYFYDNRSNIFKIVQVKNGLVQEASIQQIKEFIEDYIETLPESFDGINQQILFEVIYRGGDAFFNKGFFEFLKRKNIDFLRDTATEAYFPFLNGIVVVNKDGYTLKTYDELGKSIWKSQIIDFYIDILPMGDAESAEFFQFVRKICNDEDDRTKRAFTLLGYMLHRFKDPSKPYAVICSEETEDEKKGGGTGKGIFVKALTKLVNTVTIDGKTFKNDKGFLWQRVGLDTGILFIDDARRNFDFEALYSVITEGITVEKKNKDEVHISFEDSPKVIVTTNYSISQAGNHARRRQQIIEFGGFFTPENTPIDYFKHRLYDDWDKDEYNRFYNLMFWCVSLFLVGGIAKAGNSDTLKRKHIRLAYTQDFLDWWDEYSTNKFQDFTHFKEVYEGFLNRADIDNKKDYSKLRFSKALYEAAETFGFQIEEKKNPQTRLLMIKLNKILTAEELEDFVPDNALAALDANPF
jgi:hypothetical protein